MSMRLQAIDIEGFKSFARPTHVAFTPGITAVIGPNGSGKSNVTEAIRWVLGEQSIKQLRGKESTDVIFHGSEATKQARSARVVLTFDNESGWLPVEAATVAISRELTRDGESHYAVNGEDVRLADITSILAEAGLGTKTFSVISQGMIDQYITATPAQRKELFDEATGIKPMQIKLLEAHRKLRKTREHAQEIEAVIQEIKPRLTVLSRQVQKYEKRRQLEIDFTEKQLHWLFDSWNVAIQHIQELEQTIAGLQEKRQSVKAARQRAEAVALRSGGDSKVSQLESQLAIARSTYESQQAAYIRAQAAEEQLQALLKDASQKLTHARRVLAEKRSQTKSFDWIKRTTSTLKQCQDLLALLLQGKQPPQEDLEDVALSVQSTLEQIQHTSGEKLARQAANELTKPLQAVAHFSALHEERERQLKTLSKPQEPSLDEINRLEESLATLTSDSKDENGREVSSAALERAREDELAVERDLSGAEAALESARLELAEIEEDILREQGSEALKKIQQGTFTPESNAVPTEEEVRSIASTMAAIGEIDPLIQKEFEEANSRYTYLTKQLTDVTAAATNIVDLMGNLHTRMQQKFAKQFAIIEQAFANAFQELFGGGSATITRSEEGIELAVAPPGKRKRHISLLSGGERSLTSLALLTAILECQKPPFIVLDEVDAALDEANSQRFAKLLRSRCADTQCIVVSHNREVMAAADVLYGVTMQQEGVSNIYSVKLADIVARDDAQQVEEFSV